MSNIYNGSTKRGHGNDERCSTNATAAFHLNHTSNHVSTKPNKALSTSFDDGWPRMWTSLLRSSLYESRSEDHSRYYSCRSFAIAIQTFRKQNHRPSRAGTPLIFSVATITSTVTAPPASFSTAPVLAVSTASRRHKTYQVLDSV